ncbi:MAG: ATP-grasp domain-containing protein [Betaproteobacteria bacterium]|mgnify:CR=1 FL=1
MYLLEHDAKQLLACYGIPAPQGCLLTGPDTASQLPPGPWVVKGQITAGGRGKAGLIKKAVTPAEVTEKATEIIGKQAKGRTVRAVRVEQQVHGASEAYISMLLDPAEAGVRIIMAAQGGMEIETLPHEALKTASAAPDAATLAATAEKLAASFDGATGKALAEAGRAMAGAFMATEALLIEINPLFVRNDGNWIAGDAKFVTDDSALPRQPEQHALLADTSGPYFETALKNAHGCDYVVVDPAGEIALLTTGAGLSMMLIDEMRGAGLKPYNFLDIRTGGLRGETRRLVSVLQWMHQGPNVKVLLINIFAGITELGEFSRLLVSALQAVPEFKVPVVARLVGNGMETARAVLAEASITLHSDLDAALLEVRTHLKGDR